MLIVSTSIIAILLSKMGFSIEQCLETFCNLIESTFRDRWLFNFRSRIFVPREKYNANALEKNLRDIMGNERFRQRNINACRTYANPLSA